MGCARWNSEALVCNHSSWPAGREREGHHGLVRCIATWFTLEKTLNVTLVLVLSPSAVTSKESSSSQHLASIAVCLDQKIGKMKARKARKVLSNSCLRRSEIPLRVIQDQFHHHFAVLLQQTQGSGKCSRQRVALPALEKLSRSPARLLVEAWFPRGLSLDAPAI